MLSRILPLFLIIGIHLKAMDALKTQEEIDLAETFDLLQNWYQVSSDPTQTSSNDLCNASLLYYAQSGYAELVHDVLSKAYIPPITQDPRTGDTALHLAARKGHERVVLMLASCPLTVTNKKGNTALHDAIRTRQDLTLVNLLLAYRDIKLCCNIKNLKGLTPLFLALNRLKRACFPNKYGKKNKEKTHDIDNIKLLIFRLLEVGDNTQVNISVI